MSCLIIVHACEIQVPKGCKFHEDKLWKVQGSPAMKLARNAPADWDFWPRWRTSKASRKQLWFVSHLQMPKDHLDWLFDNAHCRAVNFGEKIQDAFVWFLKFRKYNKEKNSLERLFDGKDSMPSPLAWEQAEGLIAKVLLMCQAVTQPRISDVEEGCTLSPKAKQTTGIGAELFAESCTCMVRLSKRLRVWPRQPLEAGVVAALWFWSNKIWKKWAQDAADFWAHSKASW